LRKLGITVSDRIAQMVRTRPARLLAADLDCRRLVTIGGGAAFFRSAVAHTPAELAAAAIVDHPR